MIEIIELTADRREWANRVLAKHWCATEIMSRLKWFDLTTLAGFIALTPPNPPVNGGEPDSPPPPPQASWGGEFGFLPSLTGGTKEGYEPLGLATYHIENGECELITLNSFLENQGVGEALFFRVRELAVAAGCTRYFLTTSNDNLRAMQFYQKRGMRMVKIHIGAIDAARERVPGIPLVGANGIPCRDEVEMEEELFIK